MSKIKAQEFCMLALGNLARNGEMSTASLLDSIAADFARVHNTEKPNIKIKVFFDRMETLEKRGVVASQIKSASREEQRIALGDKDEKYYRITSGGQQERTELARENRQTEKLPDGILQPA